MLVTSKSRRKRGKAITIMLLPLVVIMFVVGWCLYWIGSQKRTGKAQRKPAEKEHVTIMPIVFEENQEIVNE